MTTLGLTGFFKVQADADATESSATTTSAAAASVSTAATTAATASTTASSTDVTTIATSTGLADGTYVGDTDTNKWGPVQVQVTVSGGTITAVDVLQSPDENDKDVSINSRALPTLVQETLTAQSADVDGVSGATYTSDSYKVSLQSAIDQARAAAVAS